MDEPQNPMQLALEDETIPKLYINGFSISFGSADASLLLLSNGKPAVFINMAYGTAKTLSTQINSIINDFESKIGQTVSTIGDVEKALSDNHHQLS